MISEHESKARAWTEEDIKQLLELKSEGLNRVQIAEIIGRTETAVAIKLKRLKKVTNEYNKPHVIQKRQLNIQYEQELKPESILELYAGENHTYKCKNTIRNDINPKCDADIHEDALKVICKLYYMGEKYDYIDLDPFGSAYDCFDLAIKMAKKGIAITFGEYGHKRFKRYDYVKTRYNISSLEEFTIENLIKRVQEIGIQNKKDLQVWDYKEWKNIGRVWFIIKPYKQKLKEKEK